MCPPGVDQTTRTTAYWQILALEPKHKQDLKNHMTPYEFLARERGGMDAFKRLYRLNHSQHAADDHPSIVHTEPAVGEANLPRSPYSRLEKMPPEILSMITEFLLSPIPAAVQTSREDEDEDEDRGEDGGGKENFRTVESDLVALALCSHALWCHVAGLVYSLCNPSEGEWAGKTLICTSSWLTDIPEGVQKVYPDMRENCERWNARAASPHPWRSRYFSGPIRNPARSWNSNAAACWKYPGSDLPDKKLRSAFAKHAKLEVQGGFKTQGVLDQLEKVLESLLTPLVSFYDKKEEQVWVLRDLDSKEYVLLELVDRLDLKTDGFIIPQRSEAQDADDDDDDSTRVNGESSELQNLFNDSNSPEKQQTSTSVPKRSNEKILAVAGLPWLTADFILVSRIGWCRPGEYRGELEKVHRGPWAGHRFEITKALDDLPYSGYGEERAGWTDVTKTVVCEAENLRRLISSDERVWDHRVGR